MRVGVACAAGATAVVARAPLRHARLKRSELLTPSGWRTKWSFILQHLHAPWRHCSIMQSIACESSAWSLLMLARRLWSCHVPVRLWQPPIRWVPLRWCPITHLHRVRSPSTTEHAPCGRAVRHGCAAELVNHCFTVLPLWSALSSLLVRTLIKELGRSGSALSIDWGAPMRQDPLGPSTVGVSAFHADARLRARRRP